MVPWLLSLGQGRDLTQEEAYLASVAQAQACPGSLHLLRTGMGQFIPLLIPCWTQPRPTHPVWACWLLGTSIGRLGLPGSNMGLLREMRVGSSGATPHRLSPTPGHHPACCRTSSVWASGGLTDLCWPSCSANLGQPNWPNLGPRLWPSVWCGLPRPGPYQHGSASCRWGTGRSPGLGPCGWVWAGAR